MPHRSAAYAHELTSEGASVPGKEAAAHEPAPARPLEVEVEVEVAGLPRPIA
jgi:hypothetical protein